MASTTALLLRRLKPFYQVVVRFLTEDLRELGTIVGHHACSLRYDIVHLPCAVSPQEEIFDVLGGLFMGIRHCSLHRRIAIRVNGFSYILDSIRDTPIAFCTGRSPIRNAFYQRLQEQRAKELDEFLLLRRGEPMPIVAQGAPSHFLKIKAWRYHLRDAPEAFLTLFRSLERVVGEHSENTRQRLTNEFLWFTRLYHLAMAHKP